MAQAGHGSPPGLEVPAHPQVGQALRHVGRYLAVAGNGDAVVVLFGEVIEAGAQYGGVGLHPPVPGNVQGQRAFDAACRAFAHLYAAFGVERVLGEHVGLAEVVCGQCPFAASVPECLLEADLDLPAPGHVEVFAAGAQPHQAADGFGRFRILGVQRQVRRDFPDGPQVPACVVIGAAELALAGYQIVTPNPGMVVVQPAHHRPAGAGHEAVFHEQCVLVHGTAPARDERNVALEVAGFRVEHVDGPGVAGVVVVGVVEAAVIDIEACRQCVVQPGQLTFEGGVGGEARLFLVLADLCGACAVHQAGVGVVVVVVGVAPVAVAAGVVEARANLQGVTGCPGGGQLGPAVMKAHEGVLHIVIPLAQGIQLASVDEGRAEVAHGPPGAVGVAELQAEVRGGLVLQGT